MYRSSSSKAIGNPLLEPSERSHSNPQDSSSNSRNNNNHIVDSSRTKSSATGMSNRNQTRSTMQDMPIDNLDTDAMFNTVSETNWTIADQYRLLALNRLQSRTLEFHNNVHYRDIHGGFPMSMSDGDAIIDPKPEAGKGLHTAVQEDNRIVAQVLTTDPDDGGNGGTKDEERRKRCGGGGRLMNLTLSALPTALDELSAATTDSPVKSKDISGTTSGTQEAGSSIGADTSDSTGQQQQQQQQQHSCVWIHVLDLDALYSHVAPRLQMDPLCACTFSDLRYHSCFLPSMGACCISFCYFQMHTASLDVSVYKLYAYMRPGLLVTFSAELMAEGRSKPPPLLTLFHNPSPNRPVSAGTNSAAGASARGSEGEGEEEGRDVVLLDRDGIDAVPCAVMDRWQLYVGANCRRLGPISLFYEMANAALEMQDEVVEFFSRTVFHFKQSATFNLPYRKKIFYMKQVIE